MTNHRIAVVGAGVIGTWHAKVIGELDNAELVAVVDTDPEAARTLAERHGVEAGTDLAELLARPDVDIVAVCVPSGLHADIAVQVLQADKHLIVEKPIDITLPASDRIIEAHRASNRFATVIHQHRFDHSIRTLLSAISAGHLGRITSGAVSGPWWRSQDYYDSGNWRGTWELDGGGALMNQGVHNVDLMVAALGTPVEVTAFADCLAHERIEVEDTAVAIVRFDSGALASIHGTTAAYPGVSTRFSVHGDRGSVVIEGDRLTFIHTADPAHASTDGANQLEFYPESTPSGGPTASRDPGQLSDSHRYQYANFLAAIDGTEQQWVTLEHGRAAVALTLAIYESARTGQTVRLS